MLVKIMLATLSDKSQILSALTQSKLVPCAYHIPTKAFWLGMRPPGLQHPDLFLHVAPPSSGSWEPSFSQWMGKRVMERMHPLPNHFSYEVTHHFCSHSTSKPHMAAKEAGKSTHGPRRVGSRLQ